MKADAARRYEELHPAERASEIAADSFMGIVGGVSKYGADLETWVAAHPGATDGTVAKPALLE